MSAQFSLLKDASRPELGPQRQDCLFGTVLSQLTRHGGLKEAQLSQRGRAMLRVVKNFATSFNVVQGHSTLR